MSSTRPAGSDPTPGPSVLTVDGVSVALGGTPILSDISTSVAAGEAVALMGENGSGKTTLVRAVLGLVPHQGRIELFGSPQARFRQWHRVGYVPQRSSQAIQVATVREVVASGRLAHRRPFLPLTRGERAKVQDAIDQVGLTQHAGREISELSGGQHQRTLIARALASESELMVLDEPMAGVDLPTQEELTRLLADLKSTGMAMLVVLHELGPVDRLIDRAVVLRGGRVAHDGTPRSAFESGGHEWPPPHPRQALVEERGTRAHR